MKEKNYSVSSLWDKRAMDEKTKLSRIMLSVIIHVKQFRITLKLKSTKQYYDKAISSSRILSDEAKSVRSDLTDYILKAEKILERLDNPNQEIFTRLFKSETDLFNSNKTNIKPFFEDKKQKILSGGKIFKLSKLQISFKIIDKI